SPRPPHPPDARAWGSPLLPSAEATHATADIRTAASPAPTPRASCVAVHPTAASDNGDSIPPRSAGRTLALTEGILLPHLLDSRLPDYELHPFFRITDCKASLS